MISTMVDNKIVLYRTLDYKLSAGTEADISMGLNNGKAVFSVLLKSNWQGLKWVNSLVGNMEKTHFTVKHVI